MTNSLAIPCLVKADSSILPKRGQQQWLRLSNSKAKQPVNELIFEHHDSCNICLHW